MSARDTLEYTAYRLGAALVPRLPLERTQDVARRIARSYFDLEGKQARYAIANLRIAYPELSEDERREIGRESYAALAWNVIDVLRSLRWSDEEVLRRVDMRIAPQLMEVLERGRGALVLTAHLGNFELGARAAGAVFRDEYRPLFLGRPQRNALLYREVSRGRTASGAELLPRRDVIPQVVRALREGRPVILLNDQYSRRKRGVFVPLFGARCSTSLGMATLALRTGAPVLPGYFVRTGRDSHRAFLLPEIEPPETEDREEWVRIATARYNIAIEHMIRAHPTQWMWAHRRFRHSPDLPGDPYQEAAYPETERNSQGSAGAR
jgi:KDO2-lipid IV(A) lauroyltransferase